MAEIIGNEPMFSVGIVDSPDGRRRAQVRLTTYGICFLDEFTDEAAAIREAKACAVEEAVKRGMRRL